MESTGGNALRGGQLMYIAAEENDEVPMQFNHAT